jgi:hypothetical protein
VLYRVYRALDGVDEGARGGPLYVPRERQGAGRHDSPARFGAYYAARTPEAAVAEAIQVFRGRDLDDDDLEYADGSRLALAALDDSALDELFDLDDPAVLVHEAWRPSSVAGRDRTTTQGMAERAFEAGAIGLSWWSTLDAAWTNVTLFAERALAAGMVTLAGAPERLTARHPVVTAAAAHLVIPIATRRRRKRR